MQNSMWKNTKCVNKHLIFDFIFIILRFLYKQLGPSVSPQNCLYSQGFWRSNMLSGCLVVGPSNLCLQVIQ